ncbi:hypothetical protein AAJ76_2400002073 [Vairimorpha ceranae]|uniref:Uncharacterized protein n=1 Tax=Vairimorpha ceranae TaxID=40302 RepID=A0A0F9W7J9_9MICR|nr:hypothetical protein AAJ76_2400002073 [Vairimorpha ceranae]KKO73771.1 hypothetical protein AAJ76_2400002073 [Vairimorpha ceranae]
MESINTFSLIEYYLKNNTVSASSAIYIARIINYTYFSYCS